VDELMRQVDGVYERAVFAGKYDGLAEADRALDAVEARLLLQRGRILHCRFLETRVEQAGELDLFERAAALYRAVGDARGEGEAQFWVGCFHQVVRDDNATGVPFLRTAADLSRSTGDDLTLSYALRHLGIASHVAGDYDHARALLEQSTALRRALGFTAGVAANLVGLIYLAAAQGRHAEAESLAAEADALANSVGATKITEQIAAARSLG
jgi:hypothetical protein